MKLFLSRKEHMKRMIRALLPAAVMLLVVAAFLYAVNTASESSLSSQQASLERALASGAVRTYALTGCYPESLKELTDTYRITYNPKKFIVEYVPEGSNLMPSIFVIPLQKPQE